MSVVTGALGSLSAKLLQLLHDEYKLQKGVQKQVQWLHEELESVKAFLDKVAGVPWNQLDEQVKVWASQVREASYDMEDALDTFFVHINGGVPADPRRLKRAMNKIGKVFSKAKARRNIAGAIEASRKHLEEIAKRRQDFKVDDLLVAKTSTIDPRLKATYNEVKQLVGVDKSRDEIISMLMPLQSQPDDDASDKKITKKVSIVGVGGLGKTTLAKVVYDKVKSQYDCGAFVSVGRDPDFAKVFKDILFDLDKTEYVNIHNTSRGADLLIREVREFLEDKRSFVVVDDVWEVKTWKEIELALVENNCGSRVITTTRNLDVAQKAGTVYKLKPLSYDNSKKLFYTRIGGVDKRCDDNQQDGVSDKILKKCDGVPLAIITMSSLLVGKPEDEWCEVYNSIGFGLNKLNTDIEDTMVILSFSYYDLPSHLRTCLLYLCTYPESFIEKGSLIRKWIAEGLVHGKQGTNGLFGLGETYFNDLINRSMIQAVEDRSDGIIIGCRVHDLVLDMVHNFSLEENFVALSHDNVEGTSSSSNVRRLAHQNRTFEYIKSTTQVAKLQKMRSYIAFKCCINNWEQFSSFKLLRVLDIVACRFMEKVPHLESLGNLLHLRYLGLNCYNNIQIPKEIGNLKLLQTLDVDVIDGRDLPASVLMLKQLVRLCFGRNVPDGIGKLISLEELIIRRSSIKPERSFLKELGSLQELRVLQLSTNKMDESMQRDFVESLRNLQKIQHIKVSLYGYSKGTAMWEAPGIVLPRSLQFFDLDIHFSKLPSCINPLLLPNLSHLKLSVITMYEKDLKILSRLPVLCFLELHTGSTVTETWINDDDGCFQKLRYFKTNGTVQFLQPTGDESSISLRIGNGDDAMFFSSRKSNCRKVAPSAVMPNLEVIEFNLICRNNGDYRNIGLEYLPSLLEVRGTIFWASVSAAEVDAAFAALRNACKFHPNHPTLNMQKYPV